MAIAVIPILFSPGSLSKWALFSSGGNGKLISFPFYLILHGMGTVTVYCLLKQQKSWNLKFQSVCNSGAPIRDWDCSLEINSAT